MLSCLVNLEIAFHAESSIVEGYARLCGTACPRCCCMHCILSRVPQFAGRAAGNKDVLVTRTATLTNASSLRLFLSLPLVPLRLSRGQAWGSDVTGGKSLVKTWMFFLMTYHLLRLLHTQGVMRVVSARMYLCCIRM